MALAFSPEFTPRAVGQVPRGGVFLSTVSEKPRVLAQTDRGLGGEVCQVLVAGDAEPA